MSATGELEFSRFDQQTTRGDKDPEAPAPKPKPAARSAADALGELVEITEREVASLTTAADHVLAVDAVVATVAGSLAERFRAAEAALARDPGEQSVVTSLMERLDKAIGALYTMAGRHRIPMRETHLEEVFDLEDQLRELTHFPRGRANRAEHYYDANLVPISHTRESAPDASSVATSLEADTSAEPRNRDDLVAVITGFSNDLSQAIDDAFFNAESIIKEPNRPKHPEVLEMLAEIAVSVVLASANGALGNVIGAAFRLADARFGLSEHAGEQLADLLLVGFKHGGRETAAVVAGKLVKNGRSGQHEEAIIDPSLSAKTIYLQSAKGKTSESINTTHRRFATVSGMLKRLPIDTLRGLSRAFDKKVTAEVTRSFQDLLVREWVNFGKAAAEHGEEVRDEDMRPKHASRLDNLLDPFGVLRIGMTVDANGYVNFKHAKLSGVGDAVLANIRSQRDSLATLAINRRVDIEPENDVSLSIGGFDVDPTGKVVGVDPARLSGAARNTFAGFSKHPLPATVSDGDVFAGMYAAVFRLSSVMPSKIDGRES
jgi:hypothetical protein